MNKLETQTESRAMELATNSGLAPSQSATLAECFRPHFQAAQQAIAASIGVAESVKDATCVTEIKKSRECRLAIRAVRIASEKTRKEQKESALVYGRAVDGFHNILLAEISPIEAALQSAEDTAERIEKQRKDAIEESRRTALAPLVSDVALYAVRDMSDAAFTTLLDGVKAARERELAAIAKAEADRVAKEKAEAEERGRIQAENARLKAEAEARELAAKAEREEAEKKLAQERAKATEEARIAAQKAASERAAAEQKAKAEREEKERAHAELKAIADAQLAAARAAELAAQKAAAAPDKEKLLAFAASLKSIKPPELASEAARSTAKKAVESLLLIAALCEKTADGI